MQADVLPMDSFNLGNNVFKKNVFLGERTIKYKLKDNFIVLNI